MTSTDYVLIHASFICYQLTNVSLGPVSAITCIKWPDMTVRWTATMASCKRKQKHGQPPLKDEEFFYFEGRSSYAVGSTTHSLHLNWNHCARKLCIAIYFEGTGHFIWQNNSFSFKEHSYVPIRLQRAGQRFFSLMVGKWDQELKNLACEFSLTFISCMVGSTKF